MAKTYPDMSSFSSGQILTAANMNDVVTNLDNFRSPAMVRAVLSGNLTYTSGADVAWNGTDAYDTDSMHDPVTNNARLTPTTAGVYLIDFSVQLNVTGTTTQANMAIHKGSGATLLTRQDMYASLSGSFYARVSGVALLSSSSDYVTARITFSGGGPYSIVAGDATYFSAIWLGATS